MFFPFFMPIAGGFGGPSGKSRPVITFTLCGLLALALLLGLNWAGAHFGFFMGGRMGWVALAALMTCIAFGGLGFFGIVQVVSGKGIAHVTAALVVAMLGVGGMLLTFVFTMADLMFPSAYNHDGVAEAIRTVVFSILSSP